MPVFLRGKRLEELIRFLLKENQLKCEYRSFNLRVVLVAFVRRLGDSMLFRRWIPDDLFEPFTHNDNDY